MILCLFKRKMDYSVIILHSYIFYVFWLLNVTIGQRSACTWIVTNESQYCYVSVHCIGIKYAVLILFGHVSFFPHLASVVCCSSPSTFESSPLKPQFVFLIVRFLKSSPLKPLCQMSQNLVVSIYGTIYIKMTHFVAIH